jgi:hypothetical protein
MQEVNMSNISPCWGDLFKTDVGIGELLMAACDSSMYFFSAAARRFPLSKVVLPVERLISVIREKTETDVDPRTSQGIVNMVEHCKTLQGFAG